MSCEDGGTPPAAAVVLLACPEHALEAREAADLVETLVYATLAVRLDSRVIIRASLPRRYGGGTGAGLQLALPLCVFCD